MMRGHVRRTPARAERWHSGGSEGRAGCGGGTELLDVIRGHVRRTPARAERKNTVELGGIEPPSVKGSPAAIRPFPVRSVVATSGLGPLTPKCLPSVFP